MEERNPLPRRLRRLATVYEPYPRYFLTLCTQGREKTLASDGAHSAFVEFMRGSPQRYGWCCGEYVLMPDHTHFFAGHAPGGVTLGAWIKALKAFIRQADPERTIHWQSGFFDHVLRSKESHSEKWFYVQQNPVRAGLVEKASDWPFLGQIEILAM